MKHIKYIYPAIILVAAFISSCKKTNFSYENVPRINFYERADDIGETQILSKSISFALFEPSVTVDTINLKVKIMGLQAQTDRKFEALAVEAGTTAVSGTDYRILEGTVKAGEIEGYLPVILYRTAALKTETKTLQLKIADGGDFKAGVTEENGFTLNWNDDLIKPENWDSTPGLATYFGTYSKVKYQFIIDVLGTGVFPIQTTNTYDPDKLTFAQMLDFKARLMEALNTYNTSNSQPLTDEFGVQISFPL